MNDRLLDCGEHGKRPWLGDVVCAECGVVFLCEKSEGDFGYPAMPESGKCVCGTQLMPTDDKSTPFSARSVCRECAKKAHT